MGQKHSPEPEREPLKPLKPAILAIVSIAILVLPATRSLSAGIDVYSGAAPEKVVKSLAAEFENKTGNNVRFTFAVSGAIQRRLLAGEKADVVLLPVPLLDYLTTTIYMRPGSRALLPRVGIGVIVRQGTALPDISTAEGIRTLLQDTRSIVVPNPLDGPSGKYLADMLVKLGISHTKVIHKHPSDGGTELVANGTAEVGMFLLSEVRSAAGVQVAGLLPPPLQNFIVYGGAIRADSKSSKAAQSFLAFITYADKSELWKASGFEPVPSTQ